MPTVWRPPNKVLQQYVLARTAELWGSVYTLATIYTAPDLLGPAL